MNNFQPLEVVGRGSETQLQVDENLNYLTHQFKAPSSYLCTSWHILNEIYQLPNAILYHNKDAMIFNWRYNTWVIYKISTLFFTSRRELQKEVTPQDE